MAQCNRLLQFAEYANCRAHSSFVRRITPEIATFIGIVMSGTLSIGYLIISDSRAVFHTASSSVTNCLSPLEDGPSPMKPICVLLALAYTFSCFLSGECLQIIHSKLRVIVLLILELQTLCVCLSVCLSVCPSAHYRVSINVIVINRFSLNLVLRAQHYRTSY
jgi:hypothetical protein